MPYEKVRVECYSGYRADERPAAFTYQDRRWEVAEIIDRWHERGLEARGPQASYFKIRTTEGKIFVLRCVSDQWAILPR